MTRIWRIAAGWVLVALGAVPILGQQGAAPPIRLAVDLTDAPRHLLHAKMELPVAAGPLTLLYPKWIPGEHAPSGPIADLAGLRFSLDGKPIAWRRDLDDMYTLHLDLPAAGTLDVDLDFLSPTGGGQFSSGVSTTEKLAVLAWNQVLLYPAGVPASELAYEASLTLPTGWTFATSLEVASQRGREVAFRPVALDTLIDSPVQAGAHQREILLDPGRPAPVYLDLASDDPAAIAIDDETLGHYRSLVKEAVALFGSEHYDRYHFLYTLSDQVAHFGLEHHRSSDDRVDERTLLEPDKKLRAASLLPHEYVHSWNGKYRRPADLTIPAYQRPMETDLLWVYEGLTSYLGTVLAGRSGLWSPDDVRAELAATAAGMSHRPGRAWRSLADTASAAQVLYGSPLAWSSWRRGVDFYPEGVLLWLDVDTKIRELSGGKRSLDDFCRRFHGEEPGRIRVHTYTFDDLVAALGKVAPFDWSGFLEERLRATRPEAPLGGIERSGWRLTYRDEPTAYFEANEKTHERVDLTSSLGLLLSEKGEILDVVWDMPAFQAGIGAGMELVAIDGRAFTKEIAREALTAARTDGEPLHLLVRNGDFFRTVDAAVHTGPQYPWLERVEGTPDRLDEIIAPRTTAASGGDR